MMIKNKTPTTTTKDVVKVLDEMRLQKESMAVVCALNTFSGSSMKVNIIVNHLLEFKCKHTLRELDMANKIILNFILISFRR